MGRPIGQGSRERDQAEVEYDRGSCPALMVRKIFLKLLLYVLPCEILELFYCYLKHFTNNLQEVLMSNYTHPYPNTHTHTHTHTQTHTHTD